ncbi:MAG: tetratricopeptide repeat protein [Nitrospirae bacterium]|nr:tetratricopeptide repeat protein [Nitrospirota bacterium]
MSHSRIEQFQAFLEKDPNNSFARYVIAQEQAKTGALAEAVATYRELIRRDPDYVAAYYHGGKALERMDDPRGAADIYRQGLEVARRTGNAHAGGELQEALATLG